LIDLLTPALGRASIQPHTCVPPSGKIWSDL
jgi:hypothetical protein